MYIGFDRYNAEQLFDDSMRENRAILTNGASVTKLEGSCGVCGQLLSGEIVLDGKNFKGTFKFKIESCDFANKKGAIFNFTDKINDSV